MMNSRENGYNVDVPYDIVTQHIIYKSVYIYTTYIYRHNTSMYIYIWTNMPHIIIYIYTYPYAKSHFPTGELTPGEKQKLCTIE